MKITIVTAYFFPEITPVTHLYKDLAEDFAAKGAEVTVVTQFPCRGLTQQQRVEYEARREEQNPAGYRVLRVGGGREGTGLFGRGLHFLKGAWGLYRRARRVDTDLYLLGSMPPFLGLVGAALSKKAKTVYIVQDIFPDTLLLMGKLREKHPIIRLGRWMEHHTYRKNTCFITLTEDMAATLQSRGVAADRISVIGNWADGEAIRPVPRAENRLFDELGLDREGCYGVYAGTLGVLQNPDLLLDALRFCSERKEANRNGEASMDAHEVPTQPSMTLLILGAGALRAHVAERIEREQIPNVRLFPMVPVDRVSEAYSLGDFALVPLKARTTKYATPSKTWSALAAGRPVIVTAEPDSVWAGTIAKNGCGLVCSPEDPAALAKAMETLASDPVGTHAMGQRARAFAEAALSRTAATDAYYAVLKKELSDNV